MIKTNQYYQKYLLTGSIVACAMIAGFGLNHGSARAAAADLVIENNTSRFTLDSALAQSWAKRVNLPARSIIEQTTPTLEQLKQIYLAGSSPAQTPEQVVYYHDPERVYDWASALASNLAATPQEPALKIVGSRAVTFQPPMPGQVLDARQTALNILAALKAKSITAALAVRSTPPKTTLGALNNLGIKELIGRGESNFKGSPRNRIHNIKAGIEKLKGTIIKPGEEFSFNKNICPVDKSGGYLPELVILATGTTPEYGGGLCQVSSTLFRAVINSGLPVTQRRNHSYAVQYYAPQGSDATTYCGGIDLKFRNDTPSTILVWPYIKDEAMLVFDFYGTKDGREIVVEKPVQYDRKVDGSMKAYWNRTVTLANGERRKDSFQSTYRSPALFHKPETPPTPPAPTTPPVAPTPST